LGGLTAVANNSEAIKVLENDMEASDAISFADIEAGRRQLTSASDSAYLFFNAVGKDHAKLDAESKMLQSQDEKLEDLIDNLSKMREEREMALVQQRVFSKQFDYMKALIGTVNFALLKFPQPYAYEAQRILTLREAKFLEIEPGKDLVHAVLMGLCRESNARWNCMVQINIVDEESSTSVAACFTADSFRGKHDTTALRDIGHTQLQAVEHFEMMEISGVCHPRKSSVCQHVVNTGRPLELNTAKGKLGYLLPGKNFTLGRNSQKSLLM